VSKADELNHHPVAQEGEDEGDRKHFGNERKRRLLHRSDGLENAYEQADREAHRKQGQNYNQGDLNPLTRYFKGETLLHLAIPRKQRPDEISPPIGKNEHKNFGGK
jgi:hypothetical protein